MIKTSAETVVSPAIDTGLPDGDFEDLGDEQLLDLVRLGSSEAYGVLFERYRVVGHRFAGFLSNSVDAKDIVSETFAQILHQLRQGRGPDTSFRSYLFTSIRREAGRRAKMVRRVSPTDDVAVMDRTVPLFDGRVEGFERDIVRAAFESLPERWRTVLWRMEVDGLKPHEIATALGMKPNAVSALACRAREGLRRAYLHHHVARDEQKIEVVCMEIRRRLAGFVRGTATSRDSSLVDFHLSSCAPCMAVHLELEEVNTHLGAMSTMLAIAFAPPASGVLGGLVAKATLMAKSAVASVGTTAAVVATTVTIAQIPAIPPADARTVNVRPHHGTPQQEPDRTQGPAADREQPSNESTQTTSQEQGTDPTSVTSGPMPESVKVDEGGVKASAGGVSASVDEGGVKASVGGVSASVDEGGVKASVGGASASVDEGGVKASVGEVIVEVKAAVDDEPAKTVVNRSVESEKTTDQAPDAETPTDNAAGAEKPTDTARDPVEQE